jgi:hypothetical protein
VWNASLNLISLRLRWQGFGMRLESINKKEKILDPRDVLIELQAVQASPDVRIENGNRHPTLVHRDFGF